MAKLKMDPPPSEKEVKNNLDEPEFAPSEPKSKPKKKKKPKIKKVDGRSIRKTGYTAYVGFRAPENLKERVIKIAGFLEKKEGGRITNGQVIVRAIDYLEKKLKIK